MAKNTKTGDYRALASYEKAVKESSKAKTRQSKAEERQERTKLKTKQFETKQKEKSVKKWDKLKKYLSKPIVSRKIIKPNRVTVRINEYKAPSVLGDTNRFFTGEMNQAKKEMFFE